MVVNRTFLLCLCLSVYVCVSEFKGIERVGGECTDCARLVGEVILGSGVLSLFDT